MLGGAVFGCVHPCMSGDNVLSSGLGDCLGVFIL